MDTKILVIDDETQIRRMLRIALSSEGYHVYEAQNGSEGLVAAVKQQPNLIILDLGLPDMEGHEVLQDLRTWSNVPVIVLSVRSSDSEKVAALDNGAQDFVTKPFSVMELLARIRVCLRDNTLPGKAPLVEDGNLKIDFTRRLVSVAGENIDLTPKEYAVLSKLAATPNCVITQKQLLNEIWGSQHTTDTHYLRIVISHLRQKIGDEPSAPKYIRTESGIGYRLCIGDDYLYY